MAPNAHIILHLQHMGGGGRWHEAMVLVCLALAAPIGLSPLLCGSERVLVVSTSTHGRGGGSGYMSRLGMCSRHGRNGPPCC